MFKVQSACNVHWPCCASAWRRIRSGGYRTWQDASDAIDRAIPRERPSCVGHFVIVEEADPDPVKFDISNIAGGDERSFRLVDGQLSGRAIQWASRIGFGGPRFSGPAGDTAGRLWFRRERELSCQDD